MKITQKNIADIAKVSPVTVSRVINNQKYVKTEIRKNILKIIKEYGYEPNYFARSLKSKKTRTETIGLMVGDIENPFYPRVIKGAMDFCEKNGYSLVLSNTYYDPHLSDKYIDILIARGIEGLLIASETLTNQSIKKLKDNNIFFTLIGDKINNADVSCVIVDNYKGSKIGLEYLISLGHEEILFLRAPDVFSANERLRAYKDTLIEHKIFLNEENISKILSNDEDSYKYMKEILKKKIGFTAIFCGNDYIALGAIKALNEANKKIPDDVSIVGYDNIKIAALLKVPLTTVKQPKYVLGYKGAELLINILRNKEKVINNKIILSPELIIRESCKKIN